MSALGSLWYTLGIDSKQIDADLKSVEAKLKNLGVTVDVSKVRQTIEASVGATPFNATVNFGNARASLDAIFANKKYDVHVEAIASKLHESIKNALANFSTGANILPKKKELRKAVNDALLSAGFEINIGKVKGLNATINNALGSAHTLNVSVDPKKLASAIDKAVGAYKGGKQVSVEVKDKILKDSITAALKTEKFPIRVIVDKAEAQDAVRQALQAAGLQSSTGFTASDKRAWDAQSRRMEAEARAAAASALAQRRLAGARTQATNAADKHATATVSLNSALKGNITLTKELGGAIGAAYSVVALKNFMTKVVEIGGELEKQKLAMKAILGDEGMANTISSQINTLAVKSPFGIMELNQYAKQLTAFQIPYNELYDTMKRMADVSDAVGVDMGRIILAYGQVRAAKFLKGTELRQFTEANIPLIDMLAERFTKLKGEIVSAGDIMDMISNKEVSFEDVKAVLWELTGEGGRFYNMQEVLSESVSAKWKNLADAIDLMFADIADSTSGPLKGLAEMLTALTSRWDTIATAVASAVIVFGVAKVSTAAWNAALSKTTLSEIAQAKATKQLEAANLQVASTYRTLTAAEQGLIRTKGKLTAAQYVQLANTGKLTKEEALRLIALKKLDANSIGHIRTVLNISKQEVAAAQATKAWRVRLEQLKVSIKGFGSSIAAFFLNPVTLAMMAIGSLAALWQRHSAAMSAAKEVGDDLFTKASEGANNLKKTLDALKPAEGLSDIDLAQGIEKMEQAIMDYSPTPINDINEALTTQDGHLLTLAERYEALRKKVGELKEAFDGIQFNKVNKAVENALADTKEGWFFDGLEKNLKDYENAKSILDKHIRDYSVEHKEDLHDIVESASKQSEAYRNAIQNMSTDAQKFYELIFNGGRYSKDLDINLQGKIIDATEGGFWQNAGENITNLDLRGTGQRINAAYNTLMADAEKFKERFNAALSEIGTDPKSVSPEQLSIALNSMLDKFEVGEDTKMILAKKLEQLYDITLIDDKVTPIFTEKFREIANASSNKAVQEAMIVWQTQGWNKLSQTQRNLLESLFEQAKAQSKSSVEAVVGDMNTYLASHPGQWNVVVNMVTSQMQKEMPDWTRNAIASRGGEFKGSKAAFGYLKKWGENGSQFGARNAAQQALQDAENELKSYVTEADKLTPAYKKALQKKEDIQEAINYLGWGDIQVKDQKSNKHPKGSQKDPLAESLKQRLDVLKKAYSEYKKELATMSKDAALERIKEAGIFDELFTGKYAIGDFGDYKKVLEKLLADAEASLEGLSEKDKNFKGRHDLVISLRTLLNLEIPRDETKEAFEKAKSEIDNLVKGYTDKWNFHKQLFELTGDRETSIKLAFGEDVAWQTQSQMLESILNTQLAERGLDVPLTISDEEAKEKLKGTPLYDLLWKPTKEAKLKEGIDLQINVAKAVADAASIADKIKVQMGLREADETMLRSSKKEDGTEYSETEIAAYLKKYDDRIEELKSSMLELLPIWEQIFGDHQYQSYGQIQAASDIAKQIIDNAKINKDANGKPVSFTSVYTDAEGNEQQIMGKISQLEKLRKAIQDLYKEGLKKNPFATLWENLKKVFNGDWKDKNITEKLALIGESAAESAQLVGNLAGQLAEMFEAAGNDSAAQAMTDVQDVMNTVSNIGKGFAEGGLVGGIAAAAGEAIGWVTKAFQASARHKEALRAIMNETLAQQREYNLLLMQQNLEYKKAATILGEDTYGKAKNAVKVMKDAYKDLQDELAGTAEQQGNERRKANSSRMFARMFGLGFDEAKAKLRQAYAGLADIEIKTGHKKTGLFGWGKGKDIYSSILSVYPDLIDANGKFNTSLAETIINTRKMSDEDKAALQNMIDLAEQAEAAYEELNSYMTDIFGELGSSMTDALVSAFANGSNAAEDFYDSVSDMLEALAKQMIYSVTLAPLIEEAQKKMMDVMQNDAMSDEQKFGAWTGILDGLLDDALKQQGVANDLFKKYQDMAAEKGYDIFKPDGDSKSGLSAGIQSSITEDTGSLVASYCNGIRGDVSVQTHDYWPRLLDDALPQMNVIAQSQLDTQRQIAENTLRNAVAAEAIQVSTAKLVELNDQMGRSWRRIAERNWGYS